MPEISRFLGIVVLMYFSEHNPPHIHVRYNEHQAVICIRTLNVLAGSLPAKVRGLVAEWAELHRDSLLDMWESKRFRHLSSLI